ASVSPPAVYSRRSSATGTAPSFRLMQTLSDRRGGSSPSSASHPRGRLVFVNRMAAEKATALVVRGTDWSETSRIATFFTREFGKVRALAKGGRRLRSNFESAFDLLSVC